MGAKRKRAGTRQPRGRDHGAKAKFIREHADLPPKEVVAAAAEQGLLIHLPQVYEVRAGAARPVSGKAPSKSAFIRSLPLGMPAKQVVAAAAERGMTISETFVYNVRASAKQRGTATPGRKAPHPPRTGPSSAAVFRKLVLELGTQQARALIDEVEAKLEALVGGR
jgi:hypothetical protein